ncbi:MAG: hypothetical protein R3F55_18590 [Alphaproteobacteria bacterium]
MTGLTTSIVKTIAGAALLSALAFANAAAADGDDCNLLIGGTMPVSAMAGGTVTVSLGAGFQCVGTSSLGGSDGHIVVQGFDLFLVPAGEFTGFYDFDPIYRTVSGRRPTASTGGFAQRFEDGILATPAWQSGPIGFAAPAQAGSYDLFACVLRYTDPSNIDEALFNRAVGMNGGGLLPGRCLYGGIEIVAMPDVGPALDASRDAFVDRLSASIQVPGSVYQAGQPIPVSMTVTSAVAAPPGTLRAAVWLVPQGQGVDGPADAVVPLSMPAANQGAVVQLQVAPPQQAGVYYFHYCVGYAESPAQQCWLGLPQPLVTVVDATTLNPRLPDNLPTVPRPVLPGN